MLRAEGSGISVVCYADNTLFLALRGSHQAVVVLEMHGVAIDVERIRQLRLKVALHRSEAMCFHS